MGNLLLEIYYFFILTFERSSFLSQISEIQFTKKIHWTLDHAIKWKKKIKVVSLTLNKMFCLIGQVGTENFIFAKTGISTIFSRFFYSFFFGSAKCQFWISQNNSEATFCVLKNWITFFRLLFSPKTTSIFFFFQTDRLER